MKHVKAALMAFLVGMVGFWMPTDSLAAGVCTHSAQAAVVYDPRSDTVLYETKGQEELPMASTTKIMTAYLVLESAELSDWRVTVSETAVSQEGSSSGLKAGDVIRLSDLAACMLLASGNEAAVAGAEAVAGSEEAFVALMNEQAQAWGLQHTHFNTASGLDGESHYTTARDLAKMAACAMENDAFRALWSEKEKQVSVQGADGTVRTLSLTNHNKLLWQMEGCVGGKTGYTQKAGRCLVSCAGAGRRPVDRRYIARSGRLARPRRPTDIWLFADGTFYRERSRNGLFHYGTRWGNFPSGAGTGRNSVCVTHRKAKNHKTGHMSGAKSFPARGRGRRAD